MPTPTLQESLQDLLNLLHEPPANGNQNVNRPAGNERDPLIPQNNANAHAADSDDDDFTDIVQGERIPVAAHHHQPHHRSSVTNAGTFFHLLKAYFSPALLTMPKAMSHLGLIPGIIGIFIFGTLFTYCIHVLLQVNQAIVNRVAIDRKLREAKNAVRRLKALNMLQHIASISEDESINSVPEENQENNACASNEKAKKTNTNPKNWKLKYAPDIEIGEPSTSKQFEESFQSCSDVPLDDSEPPEENQQPPKEPANTNENIEIIAIEIEPKEPRTVVVNNEQNTHPEYPPVRTLSYPQLVTLSFHYGSDQNKWAAKPMKLFVQLLMYFTHYGCCCVCFLFTAESLGELASKGPLTHSNSFQMVAYAVPFVICISFLPAGYEMTAVNTIAFLLQFCGVCMMGYYFFIGEHANRTDLNLYSAPVETWYLYFGLIFYAFEGTGVSLHVQSHMAKKQDFLGWLGILSRSMYITLPVYAIVGGLGYWKYGNDVHTSVSFNLPEEPTPDLIQVLIGMGVLLTFPFHLSFLINPLKKMILDESLIGTTTYQVMDVWLRAMFVVSTYLVSAMVPFLELQLSVVGATASCFLVLFMPAFMSLNSYPHLPDLEYSCCRMLFHFLILLIGMAGCCLGSYMNFKNAHLYYPNSTIFG